MEFYRTAAGEKPVADWLNGLDDAVAQSIAAGVRFFEEYPGPVLPEKLFEKVSQHIWEIKLHHGKDQYRLLSFTAGGRIVIAVHAVTKKSMPLKRQDIELAEQRRRDHIRRLAPKQDATP